MSLLACGQTTAGSDDTHTTATAATSDGEVSTVSVSTHGTGTSGGSGTGTGGSLGGAGSTNAGAQSSASGSDTGAASTTTSAGGMSGGAGGSQTAGTGATGGTGGTGVHGEGGEAGAGATGGTPDLPDFDDLIIYSSTMGDYEGLTVYLAFDHNLTPDSRSEERSAVVASGAFEVVWLQGFNRLTFGAYAFLFVDVDGDAACTEDVDPVWSFFVNNVSSKGEPLVVEFDPRPESTTLILTEAECEDFINGL